MPFRSRHDVFSVALKEGGLAAGVHALGDGVPHRYTGVYALNGGTLRNVVLCDKQGEIVPAFLAEVPLGVSFCQFVIRDGLFRTDNSANDRRLDGHPYQGVMVSYHGVPLIDESGELCGTLCHFDVDEFELADEEFALMQKAARVLPPFLREFDRRRAGC